MSLKESHTGDEVVDDWETDVDQGLGQLTLVDAAADSKTVSFSSTTRPAVLSKPRHTGGGAEVAGQHGDLEDSESEMELPFEGRHVVEIYGLDARITDLQLERQAILLNGEALPPVIRRTDERTALAVFCNPAVARAALAARSDLLLRPFSEASPAGKACSAGSLLPPKSRPKSSPVVARRLIGHALNIKGLSDKVGEKDLQQQRQEKVAQRAAKASALQAAWDD